MAVAAGDSAPDVDRDQLERALDAQLPKLLAEVRDLLVDDWPDYAAFLDESDSLNEAGELFIHRLLQMASRGLSSEEREDIPGEQTLRVVFEQVGRYQWRLGNDLTRLLTAYQVGARAAWRHVSQTALGLGVDPDVLAALAEAVFVFVNQLSSASAHGYVLEQSDDATARERGREQLADLLLSGRASTQAVRAAAARIQWALPERCAVVLVDPDDHAARHVLAHLDSSCLPIRHDGLYGAIVPDRPNRRAQLARLLHGANAVVGYAVHCDHLASSVKVAVIAARLRADGVLPGDPVFVDEFLDTVIVYRDERLIGALRSQLLRPLDGLPEKSRERLVETLTSWLRNMGDRRTIAEELHVHPQTVRYRVGQLRDHFGAQLDDPRARARLFLALVWPLDRTPPASGCGAGGS
ncbi:MAG TPA: helix-turn-helix domain-containing protein [Nocardioidaceae bacterium]|nr:helix-turn-helix domain-containing protein [Nocardioidaceae bacterium]